MQETLRVGVIGTGYQAALVHLPALTRHPRVRVTAVCDVREEAARRVAARFGVERVFTGYEALLDDAGTDAVVICVPDRFHYTVAMAALDRGKHVLCEKPLGMTHEEARRLSEYARSRGVRHMVAFTYRFSPATRFLRELVLGGEIGEILYIHGAHLLDGLPATPEGMTWREVPHATGGVVSDLGTHLVDLARWIAGDVTRVSAVARAFGWKTAEGWHQTPPVFTAFTLQFTGGPVGSFDVSRIARGRAIGLREDQWLEVVGDRGALRYRMRQPWTLQACVGDFLVRQRRRVSIDVPPAYGRRADLPESAYMGNPYLDYRFNQDYAFVDAVVGSLPCEPSFEDGAAVQAVVDAILESAQTGLPAEVRPAP